MTINYITCHNNDRPYDGLTFTNIDRKNQDHNNDINFLYGHFDNFPIQQVYSEQWIDLLPNENLKLVLCWQQTPSFMDLSVIDQSLIQHVNHNPNVYLLCVDVLESILYPSVYTEQCKHNNINPEKVIVLTSNYEINLQKIDGINYITIEFWESLTRQHHRWLSNIQMTSQSQRITANKTASKKFISLNRNLKPSRAMWKYAMSASGLQSQGHVSYLLPKVCKNADRFHEDILKSPILNEMFYNGPPEDIREHLDYQELDDIIHDHPVSYNENLNSYYNDSLLNIITESHHNTVFLTEKTFKAIAQRQPFFILGNPDMHKRLREKGYYTFEKLFDTTQVMNVHQALALCQKLLDRDIEDIRQEILTDWMPKIEHNYNLFFNSKCDWEHIMLLVKQEINF